MTPPTRLLRSVPSKLSEGVTKTYQSTTAAGKGKQGDMRHDDGNGQHDDSKGRHDDGKGQQGIRRH